LLFSITACGDDGDNPQSPPIDPNDTNLTDPFAVPDSFEKAFNAKNYEAYAALLDEEFEYCPLDRISDFPWIQDPCRNRTQELAMIATLFDPSYSGPVHPVFGDALGLTVLSSRALPADRLELDCVAQARIFASESEGWSFDSRLLLALVKRGEFWRILRIVELIAENVGDDLPTKTLDE
jgi:hypothetical protein